MSNKTLLKKVYDQVLKEIKVEKLIEDAFKLEGKQLKVLHQTYDLSAYNNIYLLGSGKAVVPMAKKVQGILKPFITKTLLVGPYASDGTFDEESYIQSSHPIPTHKSIVAAKSLQAQLQKIEKDDLYIYLLSGGNSALVELPEEEITLGEFQDATKLMLHSGMPIEKMNSVRKHISQVKAGKMAQVSPAKGVVVVLSDVLGDDLYAIGSAPFYCDQSSFQDVVNVLTEYKIFDQMPQTIQKFIKEGVEGLHEETPKQPFEQIDHHIIGSNRTVLQKAQEILQSKGFDATIIDEPLEGDTKENANRILNYIESRLDRTHAYIFGGETTVVVKGNGKGGRNQHLCLEILSKCHLSCDVTFLCAATDGIDGNSEAAGALIDIHSLMDAKTRHIDPEHYLQTFDSNSFFEQTGEVLVTGPTHNNLLDVLIVLVEPKPTQRERHG